MLPARASRRIALCLALVAVLAAACGDDDGASTSGETTTSAGDARPEFLDADVQVRAEDINFPQKAFTAAAGEISVGYVNEGRIFHTLLIEENGDRLEAFSRLAVDKNGDVAVGTAELGPGEYVLYCDVPGHRANGMEATLTVE